MAKKITDFKNPLTSSGGSVLDWSAWTGGVLWVVMIGAIMAIGVNLLNAIDKRVPGNQVPNVKPYGQPIVDSGYTVL